MVYTNSIDSIEFTSEKNSNEIKYKDLAQMPQMTHISSKSFLSKFLVEIIQFIYTWNFNYGQLDP